MTKRYKKFFILMMTFAIVFGVLRYSKKPQAADQLTEQFTTHKLVLDDRAFFNA